MAKGHGAKKLSKMIKNKKMKSRTLFRDFFIKTDAECKELWYNEFREKYVRHIF